MTTSPDENKALVRRLNDAFSDHDRERIDSFYADQVIVHSREGDLTLDPETRWQFVLPLFHGFPDLTSKIETILAEGDQVFARCTYTGTHNGEFQSILPTGKKVQWIHWIAYRIHNDVIVEAWPLSDTLHLFIQLGAFDLLGNKQESYV